VAVVGFKRIGPAKRLQRFEDNEIKKMRLIMREKKLVADRANLQWGPEISSLPIMTWDQSKPESVGGQAKALIAIAGVVHDISGFVAKHPGGETLLRSAIGKDGTAAFMGGVYAHSETITIVLAVMRLARLKGGGRVEVEIEGEGKAKHA